MDQMVQVSHNNGVAVKTYANINLRGQKQNTIRRQEDIRSSTNLKSYIETYKKTNRQLFSFVKAQMSPLRVVMTQVF